MRFPATLLLIAALVCGCSSPSGAPDTGSVDHGVADRVADERAGDELYLRGATIITATGEAPLVGRAVRIRGDHVVAIEEDGAPAPGARVLQLDGLTLLPGLIDNHVHVVGSAASTKIAMDQSLQFGVTAMKDVCGPLAGSLALRADVAARRIAGPRLVVAGPAFTAPDGHPITTLWAGDTQLIKEATRTPIDPDAARAEVRALAQAGVDTIKCMVTSCTCFCAPACGSCGRIDLKVLAAVVEEAHASKLRVVAHTDSPQDVTDAVKAGVDGVEHGVTCGTLDDSLVQLLATAKTVYVPTLSVAAAYTSTPIDTMVQRLAKLRAGGVRVVVGTDALNFGATWGASIHKELVYMVQAGYSPMEAIAAATRLGAEHLGIPDAGTIAPGKLADLIAVAGDPLKDISVVVDVRLVIRGGEVLRGPVP